MNPKDLNLVGFQILHISSSHTGGAAIAARRLNSELNRKGISSKFLALQQSDYIPGRYEFAISRNWLQKIVSGVVSRFQHFVSPQVPMSPISISIIKPKKLILEYPPKSTIIHIHNWFNILSVKSISLLAELGYRLVFTLHDQRFMTGGCHYALDCRQFETSCKSCPNLKSVFQPIVSNSHKSAIQDIQYLVREMTLIAPSNWIMNQASASTLLSQATIRQIRNVLVGKLPERITEEKKTLKLNKLKLGVASMDPKSFLKGGDFISSLEADSNFNESFDFKFLVDYEQMENFWSDIDFLFVPSRADNSPNVILEAKLHQIPVIGTNVGGLPELLEDSVDILIQLDQLENSSLFCLFLREKISEMGRSRVTRNNLVNSEGAVFDHISLYASLVLTGA